MNIVTIIEGIELAEALTGFLAGTTLVSEILPYIGKLKANSALQLCFGLLKFVSGFFIKKENPKT